MTPERAKEIVLEAARRRRPSPLRESAFPKQRELLDDKSKFKAVLCTRRAGKSFGIGLALCESAQNCPGDAHLYLGLTRDTVRRIMVDPVLKVINRRFSLGATFIERPLEMRFANGSVIYMLGVDASEEERDKILGQKFRKVAIDECGSMKYDLATLIDRTIRPTLVDLGGDLLLAGTPENTKNHFYEVTEGLATDADWTVHRWSAHDNPHVAVEWQKEIASLIAKNPLVVETPLFKQHYLGQWSVDTSKLVYRFDAKRNAVASAPWGDNLDGIHVVLGLDLGYNDDTAIVIAAYSDRDPALYILEAHKRAELTVSAVAAWAQGFMGKYLIEQLIVDPASKQVVEELRQRYRIPLESAEKSGKTEAIAMLNSDLLTGQIKVVGGACDALVEEWSGLVWADHGGRQTENPACPNHCADSFLYGWRAARNYAASTPKRKHPPHSEEAIEEMFEEEDRQEAKRARVPFWERD